MMLSPKLAIAISALSLFALATTSSVAAPATTPDSSSTRSPVMNAFPAARDHQTRHVIQLPKHADEAGLKIEIIVGKTMSVDCNNHLFSGNLEERTAEGWGYSYYVLDSLGKGVSTLMGCPSQVKRKAFVRSSAETLVRYNSRLPLVVYAPSDVEVRYRIWRAGAERRPA